VAGNSKRRGAVRKGGTKKGAIVGSGGQRRKGLRGKGPTPPAEARAGHPSQRRAAGKATNATRASQATQATKAHAQPARRRPDAQAPETVVGRNPVLECLRAKVPATALHVVVGVTADERVTESVRLAADAGIAIIEVPRQELDRITGGVPHQGVALTVPPYQYTDPDDLLTNSQQPPAPALLVALDGVTDPRNLGAIIRSAAAFGANGVLLPQRRSAGVTAVAWRTSAGAAARIPVARANNLTRTLRSAADAGLTIIGLDAEGATSLDDFTQATDPTVLVIGAEGRGLSRLVRDSCDLVVSIPMESAVESLNASVAAGIVLAEVARRRRAQRWSAV
jgi:23S rRNA (guanosine2251-2'-O)-methyltransferase